MNYINAGKENSTDIKLYYEDHGEGRPVVLIHGWPLSCESWEKQTQALLNAGCRVIAYDRRGFGRSSRPGTGYDADTFAEDLNRVMTQLDLRDAVLVGFSMGGVEVARYMGRYGRERVSAVVFMAAVTPYLGRTPANQQGVAGNVFANIREALLSDRPAFITGFLNDFFNADVLKGKRVSEEVIRACWNIGVGASPKGTLDCVDSWLTDFRADLKAITVPTQVIHGDSDRILPMEATAARMKEFVKDCKVSIIPGGPHGLNWTHAAEVNSELLPFIKQLKPYQARELAGAGRK